MAEFYGREGSFQDFYLELPTQKVIDRDLSEAKLQVEAMKENALIQKGYNKDYLAALSRKYKVQNNNLEANHKLQQDNYDRIYEAEAANAQREFEDVQRSQGNPGPNEASALGELAKFAPKLGQLVGEYIQKEREWKINTHTNLIVNMNMKASDRDRWEPMKQELMDNSLKAQQFAKAESERFGVQLTPQKMLSILNVKGELGIIQQEAFNFNAVRTYQTYLSGSGDSKIVLSDGTETTWSALQSPNTSPERFLEGLNFMRGQFLQENDINITTVPIGPLGDLGAEMRKIEDAHNGRWSRAKSQQTAVQHKNAITTQWINSTQAGGIAVRDNLDRRAAILGSEGKPNYTEAWQELFSVLRQGVSTGTTQSSEVESIIKAWGTEKKGPIMEELRGIKADALATEANLIFQRDKNNKAASFNLMNQYKKVFTGDPAQGGWGLKPRGSIDQLRAEMLGKGMRPEHVKEALSVFTSPVRREEGLGSNSKDMNAKGIYDTGLDGLISSIGADVGGDSSGVINHEKIQGWSQVKNNITSLYREYYNRKWATVIGTDKEKAEASWRYARDEVVRLYGDNPGLTAVSSDKSKNDRGEERLLTDDERKFSIYYDDNNTPISPADSNSAKVAKLGDTPGVSPTDRVLSMSKPEDAILDKSDVGRYVDSDGNISLKSFKADPLVREIVKQTNIPASDLYQRHAELYGLPTLSDTDHFTYEELQQSTKPIQRMNGFNSTYSQDVAQASIYQERRGVPVYSMTGDYKRVSYEPVEGQLPGKSNYTPQSGRLQGIKGATLNVREDDWYYIANTIMGEAGPDDDMFYVAANIVTRMASGRSAQDVVSPKGQYIGYHPGKAVDPKLVALLKSPEGQAKVAEAVKHLDGRTQFRGRELYHNMGDGDIRPNGSSNYYFHSQQAGGKGIAYEPWMANDHAWKHMVKVTVPDVPLRAPSIENNSVLDQINGIMSKWFMGGPI